MIELIKTSTPDGMSKSGGTSSSKMNVSPSSSLTPEIRQLLSSVTDPRLKKRLLSDPKSLEVCIKIYSQLVIF